MAFEEESRKGGKNKIALSRGATQERWLLAQCFQIVYTEELLTNCVDIHL